MATTQVGVPDVAAHMFIFYYAVLSEVSPPTALAAFAAAALTGGNPFRTMMLTWKYTLPGVPGAVCLLPEPGGLGILLQAPLPDVLWTTATAATGVVALAVGFGGWLWGPATFVERAGAVLGGLLLFYANPVTDAVGLVIFVAVLVAGWVRSRLAASTAPSPTHETGGNPAGSSFACRRLDGGAPPAEEVDQRK